MLSYCLYNTYEYTLRIHLRWTLSHHAAVMPLQNATRAKRIAGMREHAQLLKRLNTRLNALEIRMGKASASLRVIVARIDTGVIVRQSAS